MQDGFKIQGVAEELQNMLARCENGLSKLPYRRNSTVPIPCQGKGLQNVYGK